MPAAPAWHIHPAVGCFGQAEARQAVPGLGTRCPGALRDSRLSPGCALGAPVWLRGARLCPGHRMPGVTAKGARGHSEGTQAVARSQGARGHSEGTQARSRPGPAVAGLSPAVPCPADGADDRQYAGPRHGHQDEEPALAHHRHPPRHDRWVPAMVSPARRVWELPGVPSPCSSTHWPPRAAPLPAPRVLSAAAGINYASAARGGRSHVLGRPPSPCVIPGTAMLCRMPQPRIPPCPVWETPLHPSKAASVRRERHRGVAHPEVRHLRGG